MHARHPRSFRRAGWRAPDSRAGSPPQASRSPGVDVQCCPAGTSGLIRVMIPKPTLAELRRHLAALPPFAGRGDALERIEVSPLPGLTNRCVLVQDGAERYVLRLAGSATASYIDRHAEAEAMARAAALGLAPPVIAAAPETGLLLTQFLPGARPLAAADLADPALSAAAAGLLRRLHDSGLRFRYRRDLASTLAAYRRLAVERGLPEPPALTAACADAAPQLAILERGRP